MIKKFIDRYLINEEKRFKKQVKKALERHEFEVYYQPQYNYETKEMSGAEALMRWNKSSKGVLSPGCFIEKLEKTGLIYPVDRYIWREVCKSLKEWENKGLLVPHLSINVSGKDIFQPDFEVYLADLIKEYEIEPSKLHLEITETVYMKDLDFMIEVIQSLQKKGFVVEMDDFGSGYSSLRTLKNVPFDMIKIDMDILQESETNEKARTILTSVVEMMQKIEVPIIVEGVECEKQAELLKRLGCNHMQGYYFGKPAAKGDFEVVIRKEMNK